MIILLAIAAVCGAIIFHVQRHSISTPFLVVCALIPLAFTFFLGFIGLFVGVFFTAAMCRMDLSWA